MLLFAVKEYVACTVGHTFKTTSSPWWGSTIIYCDTMIHASGLADQKLNVCKVVVKEPGFINNFMCIVLGNRLSYRELNHRERPINDSRTWLSMHYDHSFNDLRREPHVKGEGQISNSKCKIKRLSSLPDNSGHNLNTSKRINIVNSIKHILLGYKHHRNTTLHRRLILTS